MDKITSDIKGKTTAIEALTTAVGLSLNVKGLVASMAGFMNSAKNAPWLASYGRAIGGAGTAIGLTQTIMAITDDDKMTHAEMVNAVSTALGAISLGTSFCPALWAVSGVTGIASGILGLASTVMTRTVEGEPQLLIINLENGKKIYVFIGL